MATELILELIKLAFIVIASLVAISGINSWRRELRWKKRYEIAEEALSLFYEAKDKLIQIRNPLGYAGEGETRKTNVIESSEEKDRLDRAHVFYERYQNVSKTFNQLRILKYRFMALFGKVEGEPFGEVNALVQTILNSAYLLGTHYWKQHPSRQTDDKHFKKHLASMEKHENIVWYKINEPDEIDEQMKEIIERMEKICQPIISKI